MPGRDGTGPTGHGPMTGGRRNQFYATGLTGWQRAAQADAQATAAVGDAPDPLARVEGMLAQVLERLDRLESASRS